MDEAVTAGLQVVQNSRQGGDGARLDVVQQQNAFALGLEPLHREVVDALRGDRAPVVGRKIGAPDLQAFCFGICLDDVGTAETRNAEERRRRGAVGER